MLLNFPSHEGKCSKSDRKVSHIFRNHQTLCAFLFLVFRFRKRFRKQSHAFAAGEAHMLRGLPRGGGLHLLSGS